MTKLRTLWFANAATTTTEYEKYNYNRREQQQMMHQQRYGVYITFQEVILETFLWTKRNTVSVSVNCIKKYRAITFPSSNASGKLHRATTHPFLYVKSTNKISSNSSNSSSSSNRSNSNSSSTSSFNNTFYWKQCRKKVCEFFLSVNSDKEL